MPIPKTDTSRAALLKSIAVRTNDFILLASIMALGVFAFWVSFMEGRV